jgi:hypothetical protein
VYAQCYFRVVRYVLMRKLPVKVAWYDEKNALQNIRSVSLVRQNFLKPPGVKNTLKKSLLETLIEMSPASPEENNATAQVSARVRNLIDECLHEVGMRTVAHEVLTGEERAGKVAADLGVSVSKVSSMARQSREALAAHPKMKKLWEEVR